MMESPASAPTPWSRRRRLNARSTPPTLRAREGSRKERLKDTDLHELYESIPELDRRHVVTPNGESRVTSFSFVRRARAPDKRKRKVVATKATYKVRFGRPGNTRCHPALGGWIEPKTNGQLER